MHFLLDFKFSNINFIKKYIGIQIKTMDSTIPKLRFWFLAFIACALVIPFTSIAIFLLFSFLNLGIRLSVGGFIFFVIEIFPLAFLGTLLGGLMFRLSTVKVENAALYIWLFACLLLGTALFGVPFAPLFTKTGMERFLLGILAGGIPGAICGLTIRHLFFKVDKITPYFWLVAGMLFGSIIFGVVLGPVHTTSVMSWISLAIFAGGIPGAIGASIFKRVLLGYGLRELSA